MVQMPCYKKFVARRVQKKELEDDTHKSAKTHVGNVFVIRDVDLLTPKINGFPGLIVEHLYIKSGDLSCIGF